MSSELLVRSANADLYARAMIMAWKSGVRLYDPSIALFREPDIEAKVLRHADIAMPVKLRQHMVAGHDWMLEPASDSDVDKAAAKVMTALVDRVKRFTEARHNLARAFLSGQRYASLCGDAMQLRVGDGKMRTWNVVIRLIDHDKRRFRWKPVDLTEKNLGMRARLQVLSSNNEDWVDVQHPEWLVKHTYDDSEEMLGHGRGLREALFWWWYALEHVFRDSLEAVERFGQGIILAKIAGAKDANGRANSELIDEWKAVLHDMRARNILVMDKDDEVEVVNMNGSGWQLLSTLREELRATVRTLILGAAKTTNDESGGGSYAMAAVQERSTEHLIRYDRETLEETLTDDLIGYLWRANFRNLVDMGLGQAQMPAFRIKERDVVDPERFSKVLQIALSSGLPVRQEEGYAGLGLTPPKDGDQVIEPQAPPTPFPGGGGFPPGAGAPDPTQGDTGAQDGDGGGLVPELDMSHIDLSFRRAKLTTFSDPGSRDPVIAEIRRLRRAAGRT